MSREDALRYILRGYGEEHPSQPREVGSIPIARSRTHDDPIGLTRLSYLNPPRKWTVLDPQWTPVWVQLDPNDLPVEAARDTFRRCRAFSASLQERLL